MYSKCCDDISPMTDVTDVASSKVRLAARQTTRSFTFARLFFFFFFLPYRLQHVYYFFFYYFLLEKEGEWLWSHCSVNQNHSIPIKNIPGTLLNPPSSKGAPLQDFKKILNFTSQKSSPCWCNPPPPPLLKKKTSMDSTLFCYWLPGRRHKAIIWWYLLLHVRYLVKIRCFSVLTVRPHTVSSALWSTLLRLDKGDSLNWPITVTCLTRIILIWHRRTRWNSTAMEIVNVMTHDCYTDIIAKLYWTVKPVNLIIAIMLMILKLEICALIFWYRKQLLHLPKCITGFIYCTIVVLKDTKLWTFMLLKQKYWQNDYDGTKA